VHSSNATQGYRVSPAISGKALRPLPAVSCTFRRQGPIPGTTYGPPTKVTSSTHCLQSLKEVMLCFLRRHQRGPGSDGSVSGMAQMGGGGCTKKVGRFGLQLRFSSDFPGWPRVRLICIWAEEKWQTVGPQYEPTYRGTRVHHHHRSISGVIVGERLVHALCVHVRACACGAPPKLWGGTRVPLCCWIPGCLSPFEDPSMPV